MSRRYKTLADGEPRILKGKGTLYPMKIMCCDCGLVHAVLLRLTKGRAIEFRAWRDPRATAVRRKRRAR